jgi:hypothetical protein
VGGLQLLATSLLADLWAAGKKQRQQSLSD